MEERLRYDVDKALGASNRDVRKVHEISASNGVIIVRFAIDDNLTEGFIKGGARQDVMRILKAVQASGFDYRAIAVLGTFSLVDRFGNSSEDVVMKAGFRRSTVDRINWNGFLSDNIYDVADTSWLHPTFRE